jgi:hypothetical protein
VRFLLIVVVSSLTLASCAYRRHFANPMSVRRIRIEAKSPQAYVIRTETSEVRDYQVPPDGLLTVDIPAIRRGDSVYLINRIKIRSGSDPSQKWMVSVVPVEEELRRSR